MLWPEPVERVAAFLREAGAEARLEQYDDGTETAEAAADAAGCTLGQIVKTLVLLCDDTPVVALVPGDRRADTAKIAMQTGATRVTVAAREVVLAETGVAPGAVSPFGLPGGREVLMARTLLRHETVWVGGGSARHMVALAPLELARLTRGRIEDIVLDSA